MKKRTIQVLRKFPEMLVSRTSCHIRITNPVTQDFSITSSTPSGRNYERYFYADLMRLREGCGFIERARRKRSGRP